jgi:putative ABC transport system ATP-binding protein
MGDKFYLLKEGQVSVLRDNGSIPHQLTILAAGDFFGESALIDEQPRNASVVAERDVEVYTLAKEEFLSAYGLYKSLRDEIERVRAQRLQNGAGPGP